MSAKVCDYCKQRVDSLVYHDDGSAACYVCAFGLLNTETAILRAAITEAVGSIATGPLKHGYAYMVLVTALQSTTTQGLLADGLPHH